MGEGDVDNVSKMLDGWEAFVNKTHPAFWFEDEDEQTQVVYSQVVELENLFVGIAGLLGEFERSLGSVGPLCNPKDVAVSGDLVVKSALYKLHDFRHDMFLMLDTLNYFAKKFQEV